MNTKEKAILMIDYPQAKTLLRLVKEHQEWQKLTIGDVIGFNHIHAQLRKIIDNIENKELGGYYDAEPEEM